MEAKERLAMDDNEDAEGPLLSMQRREGENRMETAAVIFTCQGTMQRDGLCEGNNESRGG